MPETDEHAAKPHPHETARLVCAVTLAAALGVACGLWINARLASAASASAPAPARLKPDVSPNVPPTPEHAPAAPADEAAAIHAPAEAVELDPPKAEPDAVTKAKHDAAPDVRPTLKRGRAAPAPTVAAAPAGPAGRRAQAVASPCPLYASAGALHIRSGGAAPLVLGGPGGQGRVSVTTPHWAHIAVFSEGPAPGGRGWVRYSVRSISQRPGAYALRLASPCGSQTIPVTVTRP